VNYNPHIVTHVTMFSPERGSPLSVTDLFEDGVSDWIPFEEFSDDSMDLLPPAPPLPSSSPVSPAPSPTPSPAPSPAQEMSRKQRMQLHRDNKDSHMSYRAVCKLKASPETLSDTLDLYDDMQFFIKAAHFDISLCVENICFVYVAISSPQTTDAEKVISDALLAMNMGCLLYCERVDRFYSTYWYENSGYGVQSAANIMNIAYIYNQRRNDANVHLKLMEGSAFVHNGAIVFRDGGHRFTLMLMSWLTRMRPTPSELYKTMRYFPFAKTITKDVRSLKCKIINTDDGVQFIFPEAWVAYFNRSMNVHVRFISSTVSIFTVNESVASV